ncbi:GDP-L-fucose synthase [bacterium]|jgi:GDP-L-fucose synthase|nr:GDP-L-fucose synthase [bacterium]
MKTLVTGANGLVGSSIDAEIKHYRKDCDLLKFDDVKNYFDIIKPEGIIHTAGLIGGLGGNMNHKGEFYFKNITINTNVIESARLCGTKKLVSFLSTCIFPDNVEYPLTEYKIHLGPPHESNYPYAYAKRMADIQIRSYREQYGLNYVSVIPTNIYGPNDNFDIENGHVLPSLIHKCYLAKKNNTNLTVWGTGKPLREFIYSKDIAILSKWALENYDESEPIIFSNSEEISIEYLVDILIHKMDFHGNVEWLKDKPDGQFRKPTDNSKLKKYLPNFEFTKIEDGLEETIEWFNKNYNIIRK